MNIGEIVNKFYMNEFPDSTELVINSEDKKDLLIAQKKYNHATTGNYKIYTSLSTVVEEDKKYYSLRFSFDKTY